MSSINAFNPVQNLTIPSARWFRVSEALGPSMTFLVEDKELLVAATALFVAAQGACLMWGHPVLSPHLIQYSVLPGADPDLLLKAADALVKAKLWTLAPEGYSTGASALLEEREEQAQDRRRKARDAANKRWQSQLKQIPPEEDPF